MYKITKSLYYSRVSEEAFFRRSFFRLPLRPIAGVSCFLTAANWRPSDIKRACGSKDERRAQIDLMSLQSSRKMALENSLSSNLFLVSELRGSATAIGFGNIHQSDTKPPLAQAQRPICQRAVTRLQFSRAAQWSCIVHEITPLKGSAAKPSWLPWNSVRKRPNCSPNDNKWKHWLKRETTDAHRTQFERTMNLYERNMFIQQRSEFLCH